MTKTILIAAAVTAIAGFSAILPAQAATRSVGITLERFADRCLDQGGILSEAAPSVLCQTSATAVECSFIDLNNAECNWPGIENQIAVNRLIGMPDSVALNQGATDDVAPAGNKGGGGGFKLNLPLKNK